MPNTSSSPIQGPRVPVDESLVSSLAKLAAGLDVSLLSNDELYTLGVSLERGRGLIDASEGAVLAELDVRDATNLEFGHRTGRWLADQTRVSPSAAKLRLRVGKALRRHFGVFLDALVDGRISQDYCAVLVRASNDRIVDQLVELQEELIAQSEGWTFERWSQHVNIVAALLDQDGSYDPDEDVENNKLSLRPTTEGIGLGGKFVGEWAQIARETLEQVADELFQQFKADQKVLGDDAPEAPSRTTLLALAFVEICRRAQGVDTTDGSSKKAKVEATIVLGEHAEVFDHNGVPLPNLDVLLCDLSIFPLFVNNRGVPVDMGHEHRTANRAQRRALARRDGGCVFPGCGVHPAWCDAHHVTHWTEGGPTNVSNMAFLCRHHHRVVHRRGWSANIDDDGWVTITTPSGRVLDGQRHGKLRAGP